MFSMPGINWYTDTFDSFRVVDSVEGGITKHTRQAVLVGVPCRVYSNPTPSPSMNETAATTDASNQLCCPVGVNIKAGDEIIVHRSAGIGTAVSNTRYFAGKPNIYVEPFGGIIADLNHMQVALYNEERID